LNKLGRIVPILLLIFSILSLGIAVVTLLIGSGRSRIYNQMRETTVIESYDDIISAGREPFLLHGYLNNEHETVIENMVATRELSPEITVTLNKNSIKILQGYDIADYNISVEVDGSITEGIKPGGDVTIYAVNYKDDNFNGIKGYELYPGNPKQYINFLKSPYNQYMVYVRVLIGVSLLFFLVSIVLNIKK
jgi:hypothetical protein